MASASQHANPLTQLTADELRIMIGNLQQQLDEQPAVQAAPVQIRSWKPERPTTYKGTKGESLEAWIFQVEQYCEILRTPAVERVPFAGTFLKEHAAMWWRCVHQEIRDQPEEEQWTQFTDKLRAQFQPINTRETARTRLDKLRQTTSVLIYNTTFREIILELPNMHVDDQIHAYIKGLKSNIASLVAMQRPTTLLEAQTLADTADTIQFQYLGRRNFEPQRNPRTQSNYNGPAPMDLDTIGKLTNEERERLRKSGGCFRCRRNGHLARDCTQPDRRHPRINAIDTPESDDSGKD